MAATNLSTFAPAGPPICTLTGSDPNYNSGAAATYIPAHVGDTITISLTVTNGPAPAENIVSVNNVIVFGVTFPVQVIADKQGIWSITYVTPGAQGSTLTIVAN